MNTLIIKMITPVLIFVALFFICCCCSSSASGEFYYFQATFISYFSTKRFQIIEDIKNDTSPPVLRLLQVRLLQLVSYS